MRHASYRTKISALIIALLILFINREVMAGPEQAFPHMALLAVGDDLIAGYGLPRGASFSDQLEIALRHHGYNVNVINAGVRADTTWNGYTRLEWSLLINAYPVNGVILELGMNDRVRGIPLETTRKNLGKMLDILKQYNLPVLLAGVSLPSGNEPQAAAYEKVYRALAEEYGAIYVPDFLAGAARQRMEVVVNNILPPALELLQRMRWAP